MPCPANFAKPLLLLALILGLLYGPTLLRGRLLDDIVVLDKCERLGWKQLLVDGMRFTQAELGCAWWVQQETILHYFRPLLLVSFRLPLVVGDTSDILQHAINIVAHFATVALVLLWGHSLFDHTRSAFVAALFIAVCLPARWAVLLVVGRKELLTGALLLWALYLHARRRRRWAMVLFGAGLLTGEHAVVFPVLAVLWDCLVGRVRLGRSCSPTAPHRAWPAWCGYLIILVVYAGIRAVALGGVPFPAPPYFEHPFAAGFLPYAALKALVMLFCLLTTAPFMDRPFIQVWLDHPLLLGACVVATALILALLVTEARNRRLCAVFLLCAGAAYLPFICMAAIPIYLYMPSVFYALAVGAAVDGVTAKSLRTRRLRQGVLSCLVAGAIAANVVVALFVNWGRPWSRFERPTERPQRVAAAVEELLANQPPGREVLFVEPPSPPPAFYFAYVLAQRTGRAPCDLAVLCARSARSPDAGYKIRRDGAGSFVVETDGPTYFDTPVEKLLWLFPEGLIEPGRAFGQSWFTVTITQVGDPPAPTQRGHRFFSVEPGIRSLRIGVAPDQPEPLVVGFQHGKPVILLDMAAPLRVPGPFRAPLDVSGACTDSDEGT
jgi:hypothetical protein